MLEFFEAALSYGFLFNALLTGVLAGVACGIVGTFRRRETDYLHRRECCPLRARRYGAGALS